MNKLTKIILTILGFSFQEKYAYTKDGNTYWGPVLNEEDEEFAFLGAGIVAEKIFKETK